MAFINTNPSASLSTGTLELGAPAGFAVANDGGSQSRFGISDGIAPISLNPVFANANAPSVAAIEGPPYPVNPPSAGGSSGDFTSIVNAIMQTLSTLMTQIVSLFSSASGAVTSRSCGSGSNCGTSNAPPSETTFANATASSVGDPHEAFNGTTPSGSDVNGKWDNMSSHGDLLDSSSFFGGFTISTTATAAEANGVTHNASATVTTHNGNDSVELNKDGSYSVLDHGRNVALVTGQAVALGHDESVTLDADKALTIVETNHDGAALTTTLSSNGSGVDVNASGSNVALGGYLVNRTDAVPTQPPVSDPPYPVQGWQPPSGVTLPLEPLEYGNQTEPLGAGEIEFA